MPRAPETEDGARRVVLGIVLGIVLGVVLVMAAAGFTAVGAVAADV